VNCGVGIMVAVWLYLPSESAAIVGTVCRTAIGAYLGSFFAELETAEPYGPDRKADSGAQNIS
jgi:hypothetical protein